MKIKSGHLSKSVLSVILTLCMIASCMTVGFLPTDAAVVDGDSVGSLTGNVYCAIKSSTISNHGLMINYARGYDNNQANNFSDAEMTYIGMLDDNYKVYSYNLSSIDLYGGAGKIRFYYNNGNYVTAHENSFWNGFENHMYIYDKGTWNDVPKLASFTSGSGSYYLKSDIPSDGKGWGVNTIKVENTSVTKSWEIYLKQNEPDSNGLDIRFWDGPDSVELGPTSNSNGYEAYSSGIKVYDKNGTNLITNTDTSIRYATSSFTENKFYKVSVGLNTSTGAVTISNSQLSDMTLSITGTPTADSNFDLASAASISGGVGTATINSYSYSTDGSTYTTISSPSAWKPTTSGTYYIKVNATDTGIVPYNSSTHQNDYNAKSTRTEDVITTITVNPNLTPTIEEFTINNSSSATLNIGETATLASEAINYGSNSVTYTSSDETVVSISGTTVTALKPGSATITASLPGATSKTVSVTVNEPALSFSYTPNTIYNGCASTSPGTVTFSNANSGSELSNLSYSFTASTSAAAINTSTGVVTPSASTTGTVTVKVTGTLTYNSVSYSATGQTTITVSAAPTIIFDVYLENSSTSIGGTMAFDSSATTTVRASVANALIYKKSASLESGKEYYIRTWDNSSNYKPSSEIASDKLLSTAGVSGVKITDNSSTKLTPSVSGTYNFYYDYVNHTFYVEYPRTVSFDMNGHGSSISSQIVAYGGKATRPTDPTATGWVFDNWYSDSELTTVFDFNTKITANKTLHANWTKTQYNITYPTATTGYTLAGTKPATAGYEDNVSFTATPASGYRIKSVTYTVEGGTAQNATAGSNHEYHFSMPAGNVTITITAVKIYTVTLDADSGFATKRYTVNGTTSNYTAPFTVDEGTEVTFNVTYTTGYEFNSVANATASNSNQTFTTAAINAATTVTLTSKKTPYTIQASFDKTTYNDANTIDLSKAGGTIGEEFTITVNLAPGYEVKSITGVPSGGTVIANTETAYTVKYTLGASNVNAVISLKAKTPTVSGVQIKNNSSGFPFATYSSGATVPHYYNQPDVVKATTESFATLTVTNAYCSASDVLSGAEATLDANPSKIPTAENGTVTYTLTVKAVNQQIGVDSAESAAQTFTIQVSFNNKQKAFFKLSKIYDSLCREETVNNPYYSDAADQIADYNAAYDDAETFYRGGTKYPDYNDTVSTQIYDNLVDKLRSLISKANKTTVYVLTNVEKSSSAPVNITFSTNGADTDWKRFTMFVVDQGLLTANSSKISSDFSNYAFHMSYDGKVQDASNSSTYYYLYKFSYAGRAKSQIWKGNSASASSVSGMLTNVMTNASNIGGAYYVNAYAVSAGSGTATSFSNWTDFGHKKKSGKVFVELNQEQDKDAITALFEVGYSGSVMTPPPSIKTRVTSITISGPVGKAGARTYELVDTTSDNYVAAFPADVQGRYSVSYTTVFGTDEGGVSNAKIQRTEPMTLWVAYDDITIYVDMNDNVGTPILGFKYYIDTTPSSKNYLNPTAAYIKNGSLYYKDSDNAEHPITESNISYLPYEMDLVTGSESVYRYTVKTSKLKNEYLIQFDSNHPLPIDYIMVENTKIYGKNTSNEDIPFYIDNEARIDGEMWFKADSTHLTTFKTLSYGSVTTSFVAVTDDANHSVLSSAINSVKGTGIVTDDDEIYHAKYAAGDTYDGLMDFNYVLKVVSNDEVKQGNTTYYFDKWVKIATPVEGLKVSETQNKLVKNDNHDTAFDLSESTTFSESPDFSFTQSIPFNDGNCEYTYVALYKAVQRDDSTVRIEVTYKFMDYDTSDGNYIYDANKSLNAETYTKTIKVTDKTFEQVKEDLETIVKTNAPFIHSNYLDYYYKDNSAKIAEDGELEDESKLIVTAEFKNEAHPYTIIVLGGETSVKNTGYYQQEVELTAPSSISNPVWKDSRGQILAIGATYKARYVSSGFEKYGEDEKDCQIITVTSGSAGASTNYTSVVTNSTTTWDNTGATETLHHNFYIVDYCAKGELVGGGVLFATTENDAYRQNKASEKLATKETREAFINSIISAPYDTEYKAQTIENVGFRYKPFKDTDDVFRYSDTLSAYLTVYEGTNVNSTNYKNQKLRLFSFMVYKIDNTYHVVSSEGYGEVDRYINHAA